MKFFGKRHSSRWRKNRLPLLLKCDIFTGKAPRINTTNQTCYGDSCFDKNVYVFCWRGKFQIQERFSSITISSSRKRFIHRKGRTFSLMELSLLEKILLRRTSLRVPLLFSQSATQKRHIKSLKSLSQNTREHSIFGMIQSPAKMRLFLPSLYSNSTTYVLCTLQNCANHVQTTLSSFRTETKYILK